MKLTPLDVKKQEFRKTLRGFDPIEVQTFLDMVAEEYEQLLEENKRTNQKIIELETKLKDYQESEKNLRETLLNVQEVKKQSEESSRRQADLIIKESELKALEIIEMARKQARQMRDEVNVLRTQKESFINRMRQILISQIELLSVLEIDDAVPEEAHQFLETMRSRKKSALNHKAEQLRSRETAADRQSEPQEETASIEFAETGEERSKPDSPEQEESFNISADYDETEVDEDSEDEQTDAVEKKKSAAPAAEEEEDINEIFKKGIQIDELIKNLDKKQKK